MVDPRHFSAFETLRDGQRVEIRALKPADRAALLATVDRTSAQSLYRRFFAVRRTFSEKEADFFVNVDFVDHVALVAVVGEGDSTEIVGGGRYVLVRPGVAELAFIVIDDYQGKGLGSALIRHLVTIARESGLAQLIAEVLPDNRPMLQLFTKFAFRARREGDVVQVALDLVDEAYPQRGGATQSDTGSGV